MNIKTDSAKNNWTKAPWKRYRTLLFNLQKRTYKAAKSGDIKRVIELQKILIHSHAARMIAVQRVTQLNQGRKTAGIDGKCKLNYSERMDLVESLKRNSRKWKHNGLREIPIPKRDGTTRKLKIPTIADRAWQALLLLAIEPAHEATFHAHSYGFRPGRSAHDVQKMLFLNLNSRVRGYKKRILELDIEKCFDRINHQTIMEKTIAPTAIKQGLLRCLKMGTDIQFPEQGTPQGGIISPLLANIALNGIEEIHKSIRYADDMVFILKEKDDVKAIREKIDAFLKERGLRVKEEKTRLTNMQDGFNFLGWHFYTQRNNNKFRSQPSKDNYKRFVAKVKSVVINSCMGARQKPKGLTPIVRGWRNYHKYCKMDGSNFSLWRLNHSTFNRFLKEKKMDRYSAESLVRKAFPAVSWSENKFVNVEGNASPYNGNVVYWSKRNSSKYEGNTVKALRAQDHKCALCGHEFIDDSIPIHLHHIDGNHNNWKKGNTVAIHQYCHQRIHSSKRGTAVRAA